MQSFSKISEEWNSYRKEPSKTALMLLNYANKNSSVVYDIGCGNGRNSKILAGMTKKLICVDSSKHMLENAKANLKNFNNITFLNYKMQEDKLPKGTVDCICCFASFHHLRSVKERLETLKNFYRALRPKGRVLLSVWHPKSIISKGKNQMVGWKKENGDNVKRFYHFFSQKELENLFDLAGYKKVIVFGERNGKEDQIDQSMNICVVAEK